MRKKNIVVGILCILSVGLTLDNKALCRAERVDNSSQSTDSSNQKVESTKPEADPTIQDIPAESLADPSNVRVARLARTTVIPFDYSQKEIVVPGRINGSEELVMLFDTGASETIIDRRVAAQLFLNKGADFRIATVAGDVTAQSTTIDRLEIGKLIINDVKARLLDLSHQSRQLGKPLAGIIGMNVIGNYLVTIDYAKPALTFADLIAGDRPVNTNSIPFTQDGAPLINVTLPGNDPEQFLMDTGAAFNHMPPRVAVKHLRTDKSPLSHVTEGTGLDGRRLQLGVLSLDPVVIGNQSVRHVSFTYAASAIKSGGNESENVAHGENAERPLPCGILGNPFWQNFIVMIDSRFKRLLLTPNPLANARSEMESAIALGDSALTTRRDFRAAEFNYQRAMILAENAQDNGYYAAALGRLGNLKRLMAHDLQRPEHAKAAYDYFNRGDILARKGNFKDVEGRILADWSLLYSDNGQPAEAKATIDKAMELAPQDATVNVDCAVHLFRNHSYSEVEKYIDKALFLEPGNWQALWYQVKLSETFADVIKEKQALAEIVKYYPWSQVAKDKLKSLSGTAK